jgi:flagellar biogenesis protein FliO
MTPPTPGPFEVAFSLVALVFMLAPIVLAVYVVVLLRRINQNTEAMRHHLASWQPERKGPS